MTKTNSAAPAASPRAKPPKRPRRLTVREARAAAARLKYDAHGKHLYLRFTLSQRLEHQLLIASFTLLALTGLPQRFANSEMGSLLLQLMGGIETARQFHHLFALLFILEAVYHVGVFGYGLVVHGQWGGLWPNWDDVKHFGQMMRLNLGLSHEHPPFGRYTFEEKMEYWALVWGSTVMILTGLMQWAPALVARWVTGAAIPVARAFHGWEAILAVLSILIWHIYHAVLKHFNKSIFTGYMTEEEMRAEHPAELAYIERAVTLLRQHEAHLASVSPPPVVEASPAAPEVAMIETAPGGGKTR